MSILLFNEKEAKELVGKKVILGNKMTVTIESFSHSMYSFGCLNAKDLTQSHVYALYEDLGEDEEEEEYNIIKVLD